MAAEVGALLSSKPNRTAVLAGLDAVGGAAASALDVNLYKENDPYRWDKYLTGTYWFVPPDALPAQFHRNTSNLPVEQQTVYYIQNCRRGVFTGWIVTQFTTQALGFDFPISCQDMFGTIAPKGEISLTAVTPSTGNVVMEAVMPGRWAAPPAPAMITCKPRPRADLAYS